MSYHGCYEKCKTCVNLGLGDSSSCVGCYAGRNYRAAGSRVSYKNYENYRRTRWSKNNLDELIDKVIFNPPATIVLWADGFPKTVVKCQPGDTYDREKGLAMCIAKRMTGNRSSYCDVFKKWCGDKEIDI